MSTIGQLVTDFQALLTEAKKRHFQDIRHSLERTIKQLQQLPPDDTITAIDTKSIDVFEPLVAVYNLGNLKIITLAITLTHKLIIYAILPANLLDSLLKALNEASNFANDVQLKILQCLPHLVKNYNSDYDIVVRVVCLVIGLTTPSRSSVVINTASATLQQIFDILFERDPQQQQHSPLRTIQLDEKLSTELTEIEWQNYSLFAKLVQALDKQDDDFVLKTSTCLEIIETVLSTQTTTAKSEGILHVIRLEMLPTIIKFLNEEPPFPIFLRILRVVSQLFPLASDLEIELEVLTSFINHFLVEDTEWHQVIVLEVYRGMFSRITTVQMVWETYDRRAPAKKYVVRELLLLIGSVLENYSVDKLQANTQLPSTFKISVLDQLDKTEPPPIAPNFSMFLVLNILFAYSDGVANFVSQLSSTETDEAVLETQIEFVNEYIESNFVPIRRLFELFLRMPLDSTNYRNLIRSLQKYIHTTGLLGLVDKRDDLISLLASQVSDPTEGHGDICLRALINLIISLGSTFKADSWINVWRVLPSHLTASSTTTKLYESIENYPVDVFDELCSSLIQLSEEDANLFYIDQLAAICQIDPTKFFLLSSTNCLNDVMVHFSEISTNYAFPIDSRISATNLAMKVVRKLTKEGFSEAKFNTITCSKSLLILQMFVGNLLESQNGEKSYSDLNCSREIHLIVLTTLHSLVDNYDKYYKNDWERVFQILVTVFTVTENTNESGMEEDKYRQLIEKSFDTLKLILDEFMNFLPVDQLKYLVDTLFRYVIQAFDLNIAFSSISYFWLISDLVKLELKDNSQDDQKLSIAYSDNDALVSQLNATKSYKLLDMYLLSTLFKLVRDPRAQVRNSALNTFFQIIDIHSEFFSEQDWEAIYVVCFKPIIFTDFRITAGKRDQLESITIVLEGLFGVYTTHFYDNAHEDKWTVFINFFQEDLLSLKWVELNIKLFKSFDDLILTLLKKTTPIVVINSKLFEFWVGTPIEYDLVNPKYQDFLCTLMECCGSLYALTKGSPETINDHTTNLLSLFNKCARYPVLNGGPDDEKPSNLQATVLKSFEALEFPPIQPQLVQLLVSFSTYPLGIRSRIEQKLGQKYKTPTFIAFSHLCIDIIRNKLAVTDSSVFTNETIRNLLYPLLEVTLARLRGIKSRHAPLWQECNEQIVVIVEKIVKSEREFNEEAWQLMLRCITECITTVSDRSQEAESIGQYEKLVRLLIPEMFIKQPQLIEPYSQCLFENSFFYEFDSVESSIVKSPRTIEQLNTFNFDASFGSAKALVCFSNITTRQKCLEQLIDHATNETLTPFAERCQQLLLARAAICLRKVISDCELLYKCPLPKIQQLELRRLLASLQLLGAHNVVHVHRLLVKLVPYAHRLRGVDECLQAVLTI